MCLPQFQRLGRANGYHPRETQLAHESFFHAGGCPHLRPVSTAEQRFASHLNATTHQDVGSNVNAFTVSSLYRFGAWGIKACGAHSEQSGSTLLPGSACTIGRRRTQRQRSPNRLTVNSRIVTQPYGLILSQDTQVPLFSTFVRKRPQFHYWHTFKLHLDNAETTSENP